MKPTKDLCLVLVTAPDLETARKIASRALEARLVACVNLIPAIESHYWWKDEITSSSEVLLLLKTTRQQLGPLEDLVIANHPYDTPEVIAVQVPAANKRFQQWWKTAIAPRTPGPI